MFFLITSHRESCLNVTLPSATFIVLTLACDLIQREILFEQKEEGKKQPSSCQKIYLACLK